jgi:hypothetical protein
MVYNKQTASELFLDYLELRILSTESLQEMKRLFSMRAKVRNELYQNNTEA